MSLTIGELVGFIDLEDKGFGAGLADAARDMSQLQSKTSGTMSSVESTVVKSFAEIEQAIADGLDPASAIAELDRLDAALDASLDEMLDEADAFAAELDAAIDEAFDRLDDDAQSSGRRAGDELVDGLRQGVGDAERVARDAGEDAGDGFGDGVEDAGGGGRMSGIGATLMDGLKAGAVGLAVAAGAAIGAALMEGLQSALDAEDAKAKLFAQVGAFGPRSKQLGEVAGRIYADAYGENMSDVTDGIRAVVQNMSGMRTASVEDLTHVAKSAMNVATIMDEEVGGVTRAVSQMLRTGMAKSAEEAFDILVKGTQKGINKSEDLLDTFNEYSTKFRDIGLNGTTALGLLSQGLKGGARDADIVADALKEFAIRARDGSTTSMQAFKDIGLNGKEMTAVFAKGGPEAAKALDAVIEKIQGIEDPVKRNAVGVALFGTQFEDLGAAFMALDPSAAADSLGQVEGATKRAGDALHDTASSKIEEFKRGLTTGLVDFLGGTVLPGIEDFTTHLQEDFTFLEVVARAQEFAAELGAVWDQVVGDVRAWVEDNKGTIDEWSTKLESGMSAVSETVNDALVIAKELWDKYGDDIIATVTWLIDTFLSIWNGFWGIVSGVIKIAKGIMTGDMSELKEGLRKIWDSLWQMVEDQIFRTLDLVLGDAKKAWEQLKADASAAWDRLVATVTSKAADLIASAQRLPGKLKTVFVNAGTWLLQAGRDLIQGMINGVRAKAGELVESAKSTVTGAVQAAKDALGISSPSKVFAEIGKWTVQGLIKGLEAENANVKSVVEKMAEDIKKAFKGRPDTVDHLLEFVKTSNKNLEDLALQRQAIVQKLADAKEYALKVAGSAQDFASLGNLKLEEGAGGSDIASGLKSKAQAIKDFAADIQALAKRGLNKATLQQIIDAGVEKGASFAEMLVGSDGSEIKAINKAQKQIDAASKKLGKTSADALYDVGKKAGDGYLKGLQESLKNLDKEMSKVAKALVAALKKELKIKSPSQVMAEIGEYTVAGLIQGIQAREGDAVDAMTGLIGKAISATAGTAGSVGKAASTTKIPINNGSMIAGSNAGGFESVHEAGAASGTWGAGQGGVNITMNDTVIREEADVTKMGAQAAFLVMGRG